MKINFVTSLIAILISALISYALFSYSSNENKLLISFGSFLFIGTTLTLSIGVSVSSGRKTANIRAASFVFFIIAALSNILFGNIHTGIPAYIITNGILLLIFLLITYSINKAKQ